MSGGVSSGDLALRCEAVSKRFGGVTAVEDVSLRIPRSGLFGLCGANGAGKTTLFNLLAGALRADSGDVWLGEVRVTKSSAALRSRLGIARTWQTVRLMGERSVLDNVAVACLRSVRQPILGALFRTDYKTARRRAAGVLEELGLSSFASKEADQLTLEGQRMVEVARAVAKNPTILLADEPASGLSAKQRQVLAELLVDVAQSRPVLMVEHDLELLAQISDEMYAMEDGRLVFEGESEEFSSSDVGLRLRGLSMAEDTQAVVEQEGNDD